MPESPETHFAYYLVLVTDVLGQSTRLSELRDLPQSPDETQRVKKKLQDTVGVLVWWRNGFKDFFSSWGSPVSTDIKDSVLRSDTIVVGLSVRRRLREPQPHDGGPRHAACSFLHAPPVAFRQAPNPRWHRGRACDASSRRRRLRPRLGRSVPPRKNGCWVARRCSNAMSIRRGYWSKAFLRHIGS